MKKIVFIMMVFFIVAWCDNGSKYFEKGMKAYKQVNIAEATEFFGKACDEGNSDGCVELGVMYTLGKVVRQDHVKAMDLFVKACDSGNAGGCKNLGIMYGQGRGVKKDFVKARGLYGKACDGGDTNACELHTILGHMTIFKKK